MAITGKPSLAYIGVEAATPPNMVVHSRDPNTRDLAAFRLGDYWLNRGTQNAPLQRLWILTSKANSIAQWALIIAGAGGPILTITPDGGAPVSPVLGNITINNTDGNIVLANGGPGLILENFANNIVVHNNITTVNGNVFIGSTNPIGAPTLILQASNGGGVLAPGDGIGQINFDGFNGVGYAKGAAITSVTDAAGLIANMPANLSFWTKPNSVQILTERMRISSDGNVFIAFPDAGVPTSLLTGGAIATQNGGITAGAISDTPPNAFSSVSTLLTHSAGAPVAVGDILGQFAFLATTVVGTINHAAAIGSTVTAGTVALNRVPANLTFSTHPDAVRVPPNELINRMTIASGGEVSINAPDNPASNALFVDGAILASGSITTTNAGIIAGAVSDTPPNTFSSVATLLTHTAGAPVAVGDILGQFAFLATTAAATINHAAAISSTVTPGTIGVNRIPANLTFSTHPDAVRVPPNELINRMTIASTGEVSINLADSGICFTAAGSVGVAGDEGGLAAGNTFTGVADVTPNGAGTFTIKSKTVNNLDSTGFIKIYINNVPFFIPVFSTTSP